MQPNVSKIERINEDTDKYPYVFDLTSTAASISERTFKKTESYYDEVVIKAAPPSATNIICLELKKIADLKDKNATLAFGKTTHLNLLQSIVCEAAYESKENLLVCAPTGSGKTNVALLTVLKVLKEFTKDDVIRKKEFKICYVAPMKALVKEVAEKFRKQLKCLGINVNEYTGDMPLTSEEIEATQMIVCTPEKWDVSTRKRSFDKTAKCIKLLIVDEIHLLHGDRGPVLEAFLARTLQTHPHIRLVGLSATLPNFMDVADCLRVNRDKGLFFFDSRFRPVPLEQRFIGVRATESKEQKRQMDKICYQLVREFVLQRHQALVFVHSRRDTVRVAEMLLKCAKSDELLQMMGSSIETNSNKYFCSRKAVSNCQNRKVIELFDSGFGIHHAGLTRYDRQISGEMFESGFVRILVCTSTLAWGVNLPAHAAIIRGTDIYDPEWMLPMELGVLDVQQIFGRAGRPQFGSNGVGILITSHQKMSRFASLMSGEFKIESQFLSTLTDNLNAEIVLRNVTNVDEAVNWLGYTFMFVRMMKNPKRYETKQEQLEKDPQLELKRRELVISAAKKLHSLKRVHFDEDKGTLAPLSLGVTGSYQYVKCSTIETFDKHLTQRNICVDEIFDLITLSTDLRKYRVQKHQKDEMELIYRDYAPLYVEGDFETSGGKANILLQAHISGYRSEDHALAAESDENVKAAQRLLAAMHEMVRVQDPTTANIIMQVKTALDKQKWPVDIPAGRMEGLLLKTVYEPLPLATLPGDSEKDAHDIMCLRDQSSGFEETLERLLISLNTPFWNLNILEVLEEKATAIDKLELIKHLLIVLPRAALMLDTRAKDAYFRILTKSFCNLNLPGKNDVMKYYFQKFETAELMGNFESNTFNQILSQLAEQQISVEEVASQLAVHFLKSVPKSFNALTNFLLRNPQFLPQITDILNNLKAVAVPKSKIVNNKNRLIFEEWRLLLKGGVLQTEESLNAWSNFWVQMCRGSFESCIVSPKEIIEKHLVPLLHEYPKFILATLLAMFNDSSVALSFAGTPIVVDRRVNATELLTSLFAVYPEVSSDFAVQAVWKEVLAVVLCRLAIGMVGFTSENLKSLMSGFRQIPSSVVASLKASLNNLSFIHRLYALRLLQNWNLASGVVDVPDCLRKVLALPAQWYRSFDCSSAFVDDTYSIPVRRSSGENARALHRENVGDVHEEGHCAVYSLLTLARFDHVVVAKILADGHFANLVPVLKNRSQSIFFLL